MKRPHLKAFEIGVGEQARICAVEIAHKLRLTKLSLVGKACVCLGEIPAANVVAKIVYSCLRRGG